MDPKQAPDQASGTNNSASEPKDPQDVAVFVQSLLQNVQDKFQTMSDQILSRIDEMGNRIDDLEHNLNELMNQAGVQTDDSQNQQASGVSGDTPPKGN